MFYSILRPFQPSFYAACRILSAFTPHGRPYFFFHLGRKRRYRNYPRTCASCRENMVKPDEKGDDAYLPKAQLIEESIRSVDYDVWQCTACQDTEIWNYPNRSSPV